MRNSVAPVIFLACLSVFAFFNFAVADDFDATSLDRELRAAGVPIHGCDSTGRVSFAPEATAEHRAEAERVKARHDKAAAVAAARRPVARYLTVCGALRIAKAEALSETDPAIKAVLDAAVVRLEAERAELRGRMR